jgi:excisionase family DNA binding protein
VVALTDFEDPERRRTPHPAAEDCTRRSIAWTRNLLSVWGGETAELEGPVHQRRLDTFRGPFRNRRKGGMTVMDEDAATASAALVSFLHAFARLIAQEVRGQPQASLLKGETRPGTLQDRKLLTVQEAADVLQVKSKRVYEISHWKGADGLRCVRIGRQIRFRMDDIQDYLERRARGGP